MHPLPPVYSKNELRRPATNAPPPTCLFKK
jgi:hypothetical protein